MENPTVAVIKALFEGNNLLKDEFLECQSSDGCKKPAVSWSLGGESIRSSEQVEKVTRVHVLVLVKTPRQVGWKYWVSDSSGAVLH